MLRWSLATALIALFLAGCDVPLEGLRDPLEVDAAGGADAQPEAYAPPTLPHVDAGAGTTPDASHTVLKDGSAGGHDATAMEEAGMPHPGPQADAGDDAADPD
jgi:hypothetical protein